MNIIKKVSPSGLVCGKAFRMAPPRWPSANAMDMTPARTVSWSLILMKPLLSAGSSSATSTVTAWARLPPGWRNRASSLPQVSPSGTERLSISCCLTKSIQAGYYSRKPLALAAPKSKTMALWSGIFIPIPIRPLFLMRYLGMSSRRNRNVQISQKKNFPFNYSFDSTRLSNACRDTCGKGTFISSLKSHFSTRIMFHSFYDIFLK